MESGAGVVEGEGEITDVLDAHASYDLVAEESKQSKHKNGNVFNRSHSTRDISLTLFTNLSKRESQIGHQKDEVNRWLITSSTYSLSGILGDEVKEDSFQQEGALKTQAYMIDRQEAETEVVIDRSIAKEGSKDMALLHVISQMTTEVKVQIFVNTLLQRGASPSVSDNSWQTPLHHAVKHGFKGVVSELLEHDALPHVRDKAKKYPFHLAIEGCHDEIGVLLVKYMPNHVIRELFITNDQESAECTLHDLLERDMQQSALAVLDCMVDRIGQTSHMKVFYHILEADENGRIPTHPQFEPNSKSCLHLISKKGYKELISHCVVRLLIRRKWKEFARFRFQGVVSELLEHDALPHVRDKAKKYPFHLAIEGCHDEIGVLLVKYMPNHVIRELFITNDQESAECTLHDLLERDMQQSALAVLDCMVDRIGQTSHMKVFYHILEADENGRIPTHPQFEPNSKSCLHLISKKGYKELISHCVVRLLIRRKWKEFARFRFQLNSFLFLVMLLCLTFSVVVAVSTPDPVLYNAPIHMARAVFEVWSFLAVIVTCIIEINQFRKHKLDYWRDLFNWIDIGSSTLLLTVVPLRFTHCQEQWHVFSVGYLLWTLRIFKYAAVFRQTGAYAQILWRIVSHDFLQFTVLFLVILLSFSGAFVLALRGENSLSVHNETSSFWHILFTGVRILIEGQPVVEYTGTDGYRTLSCIIMVVYLFVCCVVLLNTLIAQLSDTYQNVQKDAQRGLEMNRAWIISRIELNSLFIGKGYRASKYLEMEELNDALNPLEKWESPLLNEISKDVRNMKEHLQSTELNMLTTIKNRLSRQEYTLKCLQEQMEKLVQAITSTEMNKASKRDDS